MAPCEAQWEVDCSVGVREIQEHRSRGAHGDQAAWLLRLPPSPGTSLQYRYRPTVPSTAPSSLSASQKSPMSVTPATANPKRTTGWSLRSHAQKKSRSVGDFRTPSQAAPHQPSICRAHTNAIGLVSDVAIHQSEGGSDYIGSAMPRHRMGAPLCCFHGSDRGRVVPLLYTRRASSRGPRSTCGHVPAHALDRWNHPGCGDGSRHRHSDGSGIRPSQGR